MKSLALAVVLVFFLASAAFAEQDEYEEGAVQFFPEYKIEDMEEGQYRGDDLLPFVYNGYVYAFSLSRRRPVWRLFIGGDLVNPFLARGETLFLYDIYNRLYSIDMGKRSVLWKTDLKDEIRGRPCVYDRYVIVSTQKGNLVILSVKSGQVLYEYRGPAGIVAGPGMFGNLAVVPYKNGRIVAFDVETKSVTWSFGAGGGVSVSPVVQGDLVLVGAWDETLYALDGFTGKPVWESYVGEDVSRDFIVFPDAVVLFFSKGEILCLDVRSGDIKWVKYFDGVEFNFNYFRGMGKLLVFTPDFLALDSNLGNLSFNYRERAYALYKERLFENMIEGARMLSDEERNKLLADTYFTVSRYPIMPPVTDERGNVYFVTEDSHFFVYDPKKDFFVLKFKLM